VQFCDDPIMVYALPDRAERERILTDLYSRMVRFGCLAGQAFTTARNDGWHLGMAHHVFPRLIVELSMHSIEPCLRAGGHDNGQPRVRADYHPNYYAAFVHDPDGNTIEVVCRKG
jgi:catechol 2,3-dioxygenase-like lactoylglutathione lyase family enzyme